jgi:LacI family transcriptional regulator
MLRMSEGKPTINDVARVAGVSKKTVSRVINRSPMLNQQTREKVEAAIVELGYVPNLQARGLALRRNFLIGLIHDNPNIQMVLNFQEGVLDGLEGTEFALVVRPVDRLAPNMFERVRDFIEQQRLYGVLILPPLSESDEFAALIAGLGCRYVRMGSARLDDTEHLVESNDREAVRAAIQHLVALGHRRIGIIEGPEGFRSTEERALGFRDALGMAGLFVDPAHVDRGNYTFDSGHAAARRILEGPAPPSAIFASNDVMAAGVLVAARERGIDVPGSLSIVGFDDTAIASQIWPPLTTVRWPIRAMGRAAARKIIDPASAPQEQSLFLADLITRASTVPPRAEK